MGSSQASIDCCCSKEDATQSNIETAPFVATDEGASKPIGWTIPAQSEEQSDDEKTSKISLPPSLPGKQTILEPQTKAAPQEEEEQDYHFLVSDDRPELGSPVSRLLSLSYSTKPGAPRHVSVVGRIAGKGVVSATKEIPETPNNGATKIAALFMSKTMNFTKGILGRGGSWEEASSVVSRTSRSSRSSGIAANIHEKAPPMLNLIRQVSELVDKREKRRSQGSNGSAGASCCFTFCRRGATQRRRTSLGMSPEDFLGGTTLFEGLFWKLSETVVQDEEKWNSLVHWRRRKFCVQTGSGGSNELGLLYYSEKINCEIQLACKLRDLNKEPVSELCLKDPLDLAALDDAEKYKISTKIFEHDLVLFPKPKHPTAENYVPELPTKLHPVHIRRISEQPAGQSLLVIATESSSDLANFSEALRNEGLDLG